MTKQWVEQLFEKGKAKGFQAQEVYLASSEDLNLSVFGGEVEKFNLSETGGLSYRGIINGKMGYAYTEALDDEAMTMLVEEAYANAEVIESKDPVLLHDGQGDYIDLSEKNTVSQATVDEKIQWMIDLEKNLLAHDERLKQLAHNGYSETKVSKHIINTLGVDLQESQTSTYAYAMVVAKEGEDTRTGIGIEVAESFEGLSMENIIAEAAEDALGMLGAKATPSKTCPVVIDRKAFSSFLSQFSNHFSAEQVQKKLSALEGKLGEVIASDQVTLVDDPHLPMGLKSTGFDAEGVPTYKKAIIEKGVLKTYFHNLKTAQIDGVKSTGNAAKASYKGSVEVAPTNLCFEAGKYTLDELFETVENGVYVTSLQGLHAGINGISGDFSLQCHGFQIEKGKKTKPVSQITVSGNFFELLMNIDAVGQDAKMNPMGSGTKAPSVKVKQLSISGE